MMRVCCRLDHIIHLCISPPNLWKASPIRNCSRPSQAREQGIEWWMLFIKEGDNGPNDNPQSFSVWSGRGEISLNCLFVRNRLSVRKRFWKSHPMTNKQQKSRPLLQATFRLRHCSQGILDLIAGRGSPYVIRMKNKGCAMKNGLDKIAQGLSQQSQMKKQLLKINTGLGAINQWLLSFSSSTGQFQ